MKKTILAVMLLMAVVFVFAGCKPATTGGYEALKGVRGVKAFFDVRDTNPKIAAVHMGLILDTLEQLKAMNQNPEFVVNFIGPSVKLISSDRGGFTNEEKGYLEQIEKTAAKMADLGIHLEVCMAAANLLGVDPSSLDPNFVKVPNGWIAVIGYQERGFSLVPVY